MRLSHAARSAVVAGVVLLTTPLATLPSWGDPVAGTASGPIGQTLTVSPVIGLDPAGATVTVTGAGYDDTVGVYVALCVDQGPSAPSPCVGGADMSGDSGAAAWITSDPPPYGADLSDPFGPDGTFEVELTIVAADEYVDCRDGVTRCVLSTRADHTDGSNRSADVKVPVYFEGQTPPTTVPGETTTTARAPAATAAVDRSTAVAGESIAVSGTGFMPGEQVQATLRPGDTVLGVAVADDAGSVALAVALPTTAVGSYHVELFGVTSSISATSPAVEVFAGPATTAVAATAESTTPAARATTGTTTAPALPATGSHTAGLAVCGVLLLGAGALLDRWAKARVTIPGSTP